MYEIIDKSYQKLVVCWKNQSKTPRAFRKYRQFQKYRIQKGRIYCYVIKRLFLVIFKVYSLKKARLHAIHVISKKQAQCIGMISRKFKLNIDQLHFLSNLPDIDAIPGCFDEIRGFAACSEEFETAVDRMIAEFSDGFNALHIEPADSGFESGASR
jgi:hypothetical protein